MRRVGGLFVLIAAFALAAPAAAQVRPIDPEPPSWSRIARFESEAEFHRYLRDVREAARRARALNRGKQAAPEDCPPEFAPCVPEGDPLDNEQIVVTGSRISAAPPAAAATSVTNVQTQGVDEGDIVKLYGRFLIVLQDGRLFSVDTGAAPGALALVDRVNVYRENNRRVWYDEILIADNRVVVTGYNYGQDATEFSVFSISPQGRFTREATYYLSSDDYYDTENYATRLVGGNLVIYTPLAAFNLSANAPLEYPIVRRWLSERERQTQTTPGRALYNARDVHRPIQATFHPVIHTISVCPLGGSRAGDELECRATAIVGPPGREFYVANDAIYLWTYPVFDGQYRSHHAARCETNPANFAAAAPAALYQIPLNGGAPTAQFIAGRPYDQLSMDSDGRAFRALSVWQDLRCITWANAPAQLPLRYVSAPLSGFSAKPEPIAERRYTRLPDVGVAIENRFTSGHLVYSGRAAYDSSAPEPREGPRPEARIVAVPLDAPENYAILSAPHDALRVERVGENAIITGYRDARGLSVSLIDLSAAPRIASTILLADRFESEGRSHAFNAAIDPDGSGLMGLPTEMRRAESGRWWWRSGGSDVSFISLADGALADQGYIRGTSPRAESYQCEVSCIDWYGNTRALFIAGRIFALSGTELIEGVLTERGMGDLARVNLTEPVQR
ncbi:MAG TPA: beta-propeller domain-containing protein [Terricaulis sp.]|nr:beta-propeller domain-containing protein [Terricaulis sp.]